MIHYSYMLIDERDVFAKDLPVFFDLVKTSGYEGVEFNLTPGLIKQLDRLEEALKDTGLKTPSFLTGAAYGEGLCLSSPDASVRSRTVERLLSYFEVAHRFQSVLVVGLLQGLRSDEADSKIANQRIVECLREVADAAQEQGVELVIEPVNHLQVGFNNSVAEVCQLIEAIGSPVFRPMVDTLHMNIEETSLTQPIHVCGTALRHVHLCESNGAALGSGHIDFDAVLKALNEIGYDGFASVKIYRNASLEEAVVESIGYLRTKN